MNRTLAACGALTILTFFAVPASCENLFTAQAWQGMTADERANQIGDSLTVLVFQMSEARNSSGFESNKSTGFSGAVTGGNAVESGEVSIARSFSGNGVNRRAESLVAQLTVTVVEVLPNGDLRIEGGQNLTVNGETTAVGVRGRIRKADIRSDNTVLSTRIGEAEINYDGKGFVTRSAKPGIVTQIFDWLRLG